MHIEGYKKSFAEIVIRHIFLWFFQHYEMCSSRQKKRHPIKPPLTFITSLTCFSVFKSEPSRVMQIYKSSDLRFTVNNSQLACRTVKTLNLPFSVTLVLHINKKLHYWDIQNHHPHFELPLFMCQPHLLL